MRLLARLLRQLADTARRKEVNLSMNLALSALTSLVLGLGLSTTLPRINSNVNGDAQLSTGLRVRPILNATLEGNATINTSANTQAQGTAGVNANGNAQAQTNANASAQVNASSDVSADAQGNVVLDLRLPQLSLDVSGNTEAESDALISIGI